MNKIMAELVFYFSSFFLIIALAGFLRSRRPGQKLLLITLVTVFNVPLYFLLNRPLTGLLIGSFWIGAIALLVSTIGDARPCSAVLSLASLYEKIICAVVMTYGVIVLFSLIFQVNHAVLPGDFGFDLAGGRHLSYLAINLFYGYWPFFLLVALLFLGLFLSVGHIFEQLKLIKES